MKTIPFRSGVHPPEHKSLSKDKSIEKLNASDIMVYPVRQHIGAPATSVVKPGDEVLCGSVIASASSFVSSSVHSACSGRVKTIEDRPLLNGLSAPCIVIENDGEYKTIDGVGTFVSLDSLSVDDIKQKIADSGIVGLGGAGFPTSVKLSPKSNSHIDYVIVNGAECEPYLTSDYRVMLERSDKVIDGLDAVLRIFPNAKGIIAVEDNKPDAIERLSKKVSGQPKIEVFTLKTRYPQGGERRLIATVTGRMINSHLLPADAGVIVINASTACAIYDAVCLNIPLFRRVITVTGDGAVKPGNYDVPIGADISDIISQCGGLKDDTRKIISGGPMMGFAMPSLDFPVTKTFSSILALTVDDVENMKSTPCIRCGRCATVCPENLVPQLMAQASKREDAVTFERLGGMECIECGCCTYVCPAKRPLTQTFKLQKAAVRAIKNKEGK